ncbi:MAG: long-chain fatty acid--CoA ligase [Burkholderiales bacterium]|nr:long-chain fatty acid--CoA ligase [Burkholderiales bacterium]
MLNIAAHLQRSAALTPCKVAIHCGDRTLSYGQLDGAANQVANALRRLGVGRGDRVVLACPNLPEFPIVYYGILKAGAIVVPINALLKAPEIAEHLRESQARAFFCFEGSAEGPLHREGWKGHVEAATGAAFVMITADPHEPSAIAGARTLGELMRAESPAGDYAPMQETDTAVILYTSGTTGRSKGAELTHSNLALNIAYAALMCKMDAADTHLIALPLFLAFGQTTQMNAAILVGATMVLMPRFDADGALALMERHGVTIFAGVPTMYIALLNLAGAAQAHDLGKIAARLRLTLSGGSAMPVAVLSAFEERFGAPVLEGYGLAETSPVASFNFLDSERLPASVGKPLYGVEIKLVDRAGRTVAIGETGEIAIRGHNVTKGYFNRPEATAQAIVDGWLHTGDVGRIDDSGSLFIVDRVTDMIIRGGFNVYPRELEEVLMTHPAVAQAAVVGVPHATHGEEVKAVLVLEAGAATTPEAIVEWCRERMAGYKYPRVVEIVAGMPTTATGKIIKRDLRA